VADKQSLDWWEFYQNFLDGINEDENVDELDDEEGSDFVLPPDLLDFLPPVKEKRHTRATGKSKKFLRLKKRLITRPVSGTVEDLLLPLSPLELPPTPHVSPPPAAPRTAPRDHTPRRKIHKKIFTHIIPFFEADSLPHPPDYRNIIESYVVPPPPPQDGNNDDALLLFAITSLLTNGATDESTPTTKTDVVAFGVSLSLPVPQAALPKRSCVIETPIEDYEWQETVRRSILQASKEALIKKHTHISPLF